MFSHSGRDPDQFQYTEYDEGKIQELAQQSIWNKVDGQASYLENAISNYQSVIQQLHYGEEDKYQKLFIDNPIRYSDDDLFFIKEKQDGSYMIAILNRNQKRLYTLEVFF